MAGYSVQPNADQKATIKTISIIGVVILVMWNIPVLAQLLKPFKLLAVALHEMGHAFMIDLSGGRVIGLVMYLELKRNANEGGLTQFSGGSALLSLPAGYLGTMFWGALLIYASFSNYASMIASVAVSAALGYTLLYAQNQLTVSIVLNINSVLFGIALFAGFYFYDNSKYLRNYVMFLGTTISIFALYDIMDDLINRSIQGSDASQFAQLAGGNAREWGGIWLAMGIFMLVGGIMAALNKYKNPGPITKLLP